MPTPYVTGKSDVTEVYAARKRAVASPMVSSLDESVRKILTGGYSNAHALRFAMGQLFALEVENARQAAAQSDYLDFAEDWVVEALNKPLDASSKASQRFECNYALRQFERMVDRIERDIRAAESRNNQRVRGTHTPPQLVGRRAS